MSELSLPLTEPATSWRDACRGVLRLYPIGVVLLAWELLAKSGTISPLLLPDVETVLVELWKFARSGDLAFHGLITLRRALIGFSAAIVAGIAIGTLLARSRIAARYIEPIFIFGYPIPKISLYPVFISIFGFGDASKIVLIFLECLYPITVQTMAGMRTAEKVLVWTSENAGASRSRIFWRVLVPSAAPLIFAGIRIALPISLIVTIITELIGESRGLGYVVAFASASFEPARAMAAFIVIATIGFSFDRTLSWARRRLIYWRGDGPHLK
jgi:NitT/TauT family transport system permease protein